MLTKIRDFVKGRFYDIMLFIIVVLLILLAFASGYIFARNQFKSPIQIEYKQP